MDNTITFIINYNPLENTVRFSVRRYGRNVNIADGEELKDYENTDGLFSLEGHQDKIFKYIGDNFDGEQMIAIEINVPQIGYEKWNIQFDRFNKAVKSYNRSNVLQLHPVVINVIPYDAIVSDSIEGQLPHKTVSQANIAVVGKTGAGKTELIKGMCNHVEINNESMRNKNGFIRYTDSETGSNWYEVAGIEIEKYSIDRTNSILSRLVKENGVNVILYCFRCRTGKIEDIERDFIVELKRDYPDLRIFAVVTECIDDDVAHEFAQKISLSTKQTKVFLVLARELRCKSGYLEPFGLEELTSEIYGGIC